MITTFERLAKVLKGEAPAANWIEKAFTDLVSAIGAVLPSVSNSDRGKFLGVNTSNNNLGWKTIRQVPDVENADKGKYLHANNSTGALEWSEAGGGTAIFEGTLVSNIFTPNNWGFNDLSLAIENGLIPVVITVSQEEEEDRFYKNVLYLKYHEIEENVYTIFYFASSDFSTDEITGRLLEVNPQGGFYYTEYTYSISPTT